jgi:peroxiredoxin
MKTLSLHVLVLAAACGASQAPSEGTGAPSPVTTAPAPPATAPAAAPADRPAADAAPDFTLPDLDGNPVALSSLRGKIVVLEWFNPGCPFVRYAHSDGPLRDLAARHMATGIVWLAINSGARGKQGYGVELNREWSQKWHMQNPVLLDEKGDVGRAYGAIATPHMFVIDPRGALVYKGALDNAPLGKVPSEGHRMYLDDALAAVSAGRPVEVAETKPYGCSVKYDH